MVMKYSKCWVSGCGTKGGKQFCFPRPADRALKWIEFCRNPKTKRMPIKKLHGSARICIKHFDVSSFTYPTSGYLLRTAMPTLFPPPDLLDSQSETSCPESLSETSCYSNPTPSSSLTSCTYSPNGFSPSTSSASTTLANAESRSRQSSSSSVSSQLFEELSGADEMALYDSEQLSNSMNRHHMIEELPELYFNVTLPFLEKEPIYVKWVYDIINGEADQERIVFQSSCKDDKNGFLMIRDRGWDGENVERLHLIALPYRPGLMTIRDLRASHLPLLRNIYDIGKEVIEEKYGVPASQLRIFLQYLPSFYHLNVHFTMVNEEIYGTHVGKAHLLYSVINNLILCPNYYEVANLQFYVEESHELCGKLKQHGIIRRIRRRNSRLT